MPNVCMTVEEAKNLKNGDEITVRPLNDLKREFGNPIHVECGWADEMDELCGKTLNVKEIELVNDGAQVLIKVKYHNWVFVPELLEPYTPPVPSEEMSQMWEEMILGGVNAKR